MSSAGAPAVASTAGGDGNAGEDDQAAGGSGDQIVEMKNRCNKFFCNP